MSLAQQLANVLNLYIIAPTFYGFPGLKGQPQFNADTPLVRRNPDEKYQDGYAYSDERFGQWVLFRPGGDPTAERSYRVLGYYTFIGQPKRKDGALREMARESGVNEYLEICTNHAETLIEADIPTSWKKCTRPNWNTDLPSLSR